MVDRLDAMKGFLFWLVWGIAMFWLDLAPWWLITIWLFVPAWYLYNATHK